MKNENGSVVVWITALCAICMMVALGLANLGHATRNASLAQNAADAAALSGAYEIAHSKSSKACSSAKTAASKNNAKVTSCKHDEEEIIVEVQLINDSRITAKARAEIT